MIRFLSLFILVMSCGSKPLSTEPTLVVEQEIRVLCGADQLDVLLPLIQNKSVALVVNHTAVVSKTHLVDTLRALGVSIKKILAPEHGFRGTADAGEKVNDSKDSRTGLNVISLYGNNKKPTAEHLSDVDVVVFDIQDVGARFYTYISTLHYVMEACAENNKKLLVLDRPNPNGNYVDGPVLQEAQKSFVGMHPVPIVHGLTIGEYAQMIDGEKWIPTACNLEVIKVKNWRRNDSYSLTIKPSPNLPNDAAVKLYPSLCLFEGTVISVGRGTENPFQQIGHPQLQYMEHSFTPKSISGMSKNPPYENELCYGIDLSGVAVNQRLNLSYLRAFYKAFPDKEKFFTPFFDKLAGNTILKQQIIDGLTEQQIRESWKKDLEVFKEKRKKYLLYQ